MKELGLVIALALATSQAQALGASLYQLDMPLRDASGATVGLDVFRGHPVIVSMFYGTCPAACPLLMERLREVESKVDRATRRDLRVLLVSFDFARDTPQMLTSLANAHRLDLSRWELVAASDEDAQTLAAVLGIHYKRVSGGMFQHTSRLVLVDRQGDFAARYDAFDIAPERVAAKLQALER